MGKEKKRYLPERLPIRLDDLDPRHDINGAGRPTKHIFGILNHPFSYPDKKRARKAKTER